MKKPFLFTFLLITCFYFSFSQTGEVISKHGAKGLYIEHTVAAKENFYSIGRAFNVHPKHLASFNGLEMGKGLSLGQIINIPLTDTNFNHKSAEGTPVYYKIASKQTVGTISALSKTPSENVRKWNKMTADNIPADSKLIIGYLVSEAPTTDIAVVTKEIVTETKPVVPEKKEVEQTVRQEEPKAASTVKIDAVKDEAKQIVKEDLPKAEQVTQIAQTVAEGDGYFKASFTQQAKAFPSSKEETVTAGIFKTTSGWNDGKYYALIDGVEPGTIISVVNPNNNKTVYAKVLGQMSGIRQNQGLNLRISNAAVAALEINEIDKFVVKIHY